jgi:importin subunit alpha-6/7
VINAGIIGPLLQLLQTAEFDIKKEAAWAVSNATSGGSPEQIKYVFLNLCITSIRACVQLNTTTSFLSFI